MLVGPSRKFNDVPFSLFGLYKDDALAISTRANGQPLNRLRIDRISILNSMELKIKIRTNLIIVNFLDVM